ncbi:hypothetical protein DPMN_174020 [Dreissena polymorpha]|uniref:Uncharacterized protein n=1 Tax=Dreissena polymorpha TaxID=45954 RepID=A0A9D4E4L2_DREPO|nr:hypothetical protein DPMN_174020 [Dreissena polymorpha]
MFGERGMRAQYVNEKLLKEMFAWGPEIVIVSLGGDDITTLIRPGHIGWTIVELCHRIRASGVRHVIVAGICKRHVFWEEEMDINRYVKIKNAINKKVMKKFPVASMMYVCESGHWSDDGVHLSVAGMLEYCESLRRRLVKDVSFGSVV